MGRLGRAIAAVNDVLDYSAAVLGGVASWLQCAHSDRLSRWLRDNEDYEPEPVA